MASNQGTYATGIRKKDAREEWLTTNREAAKILEGYLKQAEDLFKKRIQEAGLVLSGDMLNSFRTYAAQEADGYVTARLQMSATARIRDLKSMNYVQTPPLQAMEYFVEKKGLEHFAFVPGYPTLRKVRPDTELACVERIAWAYKMAIRRRPNLKRGYRGIYSDPLLKDVMPYLFRDLSTAAGLTAMRAFKALFNA